MKRVAVLMGGVSNEREISLASGSAIVEALKLAGFEVVPIILQEERLDALPDDIEAVFLALHGGYGENGGIQGCLDAMRMPYTGPGVVASRIAMDKIATKRILESAGIATAPYEVLSADCDVTSLELPVVVKPPRDGSSVGISKVTCAEQWPSALKSARDKDAQGEVLVEKYIHGREWTVGIVGNQAMPIVEIKTPDAWYGFTEKYTKGVTQYLFPETAEDAPLVAVCQMLALLAFKAVGCRGVSRVDFRITPEGKPYILEINTIPGFTSTSLLPKAAAKLGWSFSKLCTMVLQQAKYD